MKNLDLDDFLASIKWIWRNERGIFEKEFAEYIGTKYAIGTSFGRTALYLGLKAIDVKDRDVLIPTFTCTVVRHAVIMAGAIPRFVDINLNSFDLNLDDLKGKITSKAKVIILIHYFGRVARNMYDVIEIARQNNLILIEDCAHSLGAEFAGQKIGTFGDFSIFSLTKGTINFGGGVLVTDNYNIYQKAKAILEEEKRIPLQTRIVDFPLTLAYGLEQAIDKLVFDRVQKSIFKWWLIDLPKSLIKIRGYVIQTVKLILLTKFIRRKRVRHHVYKTKINSSIHYPQGIHMEPIIASLARTQLRKIDSLIERRKEICDNLAKLENYHLEDSDGSDVKDVHTHLLLRFPGHDIFEVIQKCKKYGLLLRATWPTHQKLWKNQDTENVKRIEREILTWNVSPMLNSREIDKFFEILNACQKEVV